MSDEYSENETTIDEKESADSQDYENLDEKSGMDRGRVGRGPITRGGKVFFKKKVCKFCTQKLKADYKVPEGLRRFTTDRGKILPRRITGTCAKHQRALTVEIKKARCFALLPFVEK
jgi:small subunit ribosomal protein S18